ncbi:tyrosine-type recombinase/integrase [Siphonobacter sp. SORGH_AS_0500]|uniref:tyrosine-type recombinase/integrase n=1 Tax=Siphonobacter sp. SORGH_AS_0500 TaxID=1864824 RepID=UPI00286BBD22|nr:tyrosine-type recombinase/integrase [Siphonobacter sp. SORGH_AS_0500]
MSDKLYPYVLAKLYKASGETDQERLSKQWVVAYKCWSEIKNKMVRKRIVIGGDTIAEREKEAKRTILEINKLLKAGAFETNEPQIVPNKKETLFSYSKLIDAIEYYLKIKKVELKSRSYTTYKQSAMMLMRYLEQENLNRILIKDFHSDIASNFSEWSKIDAAHSNRTHNKHRDNIFSFFNYLISKKLITENPFSVVRSLPTKSSQHRPFTVEQINDFKTVCLEERKDVQLWFFVNMLYFTFMRPHEEARLLKVSDIKRSIITVWADRAKTSNTRHVKIPPGLEAIFQQLNIRSYSPHYYVFTAEGVPGPKPVSTDYFYKRHVTVLKKLNLFGFNYDLYGWKHTGVIALYRATKDIKLIQNQAGHTNIQQTDEYLRDLGLYAEDFDLSGFPPPDYLV